jgi:hypothetical protein
MRMALQSQLFRGDPKLEAAAVSDPDHIVPGATGPHVGKIQQALIRLDGATIAQDSNYGPQTADAVLAYKQKRDIVNRSYETKADNIVGKMTMAALDKEMLALEGGAPAPGGKLLLGFGLSGLPGIHWGVDTNGPASFPVKNKRGEVKPLFDIVTEELGMPEFWGRYLFKGVKTGTTALSKAEVDFISKRSGGKCRILLAANFAGSQFNVKGAEKATGRNNATIACAVCGPNGLKVPGGVWIYADIEPEFQCSSGWFQGWWEVMQQAGRGRGRVYESPRELGFNKPYRAAYRATMDIFSKALNDNPPLFPPDPPKTARLLWSQRPVPFFKKDIDPNNFKPAAYTPSEPDFVKGMTVLWQYGGNCAVVPKNKNSIIDMNLATDQGLASMWKP